MTRYASDPDGIRTRVAGVKGQCPRPLDDGDGLENKNLYPVVYEESRGN